MTQLFVNAARAELAQALGDTDTELVIESGGELFPVATTGSAVIGPQADWFRLVVQDVEGNYEVMYCRSHEEGSLVFGDLIRAQEDTEARDFPVSSVVGNRPTAGNATDWEAKQEKLVSGTNIKTINGQEVLGAGDLVLTPGGVVVSATAPMDPDEGREWLDTTSGITYTWVNTGGQFQWVELSAGGAVEPAVDSVNGKTGLVVLEIDDIPLLDVSLQELTDDVDSLNQGLGAKLNMSGGTATGLKFTVSALGNITGATTIDLATAQEFTATVTGNVTLSFANAPAAGESQVVYLRLSNAGAFTITWPAGTKFDDSTAPELTATGADLLGVKYDATTSTYMVFVIGLNVGVAA